MFFLELSSSDPKLHTHRRIAVSTRVHGYSALIHQLLQGVKGQRVYVIERLLINSVFWLIFLVFRKLLVFIGRLFTHYNLTWLICLLPQRYNRSWIPKRFTTCSSLHKVFFSLIFLFFVGLAGLSSCNELPPVFFKALNFGKSEGYLDFIFDDIVFVPQRN